MEVESSPVSIYIEHFTCEVEVGYKCRCHCLGVHFGGVDAAGGHFGMLEAFSVADAQFEVLDGVNEGVDLFTVER